MAAQESKDLVRRFYDACNAGRWEAMDEILAADFVDHSPGPGQGKGVEELKQLGREYKIAFPDSIIEVNDTIAEGDRVAARTTFHGTHRGAFFGITATGRPVAMTGTHVFRIVGGRIAEMWGNQDDLGLMRQLSAVPEVATVPYH